MMDAFMPITLSRLGGKIYCSKGVCYKIESRYLGLSMGNDKVERIKLTIGIYIH
jgi:hypothetical protein